MFFRVTYGANLCLALNFGNLAIVAILAILFCYPPRMSLSICIITLNEEANIGRTLDSVREIADEIIVVDSGSTDSTVSIAQSYGAKVVVESWKGFARQ